MAMDARKQRILDSEIARAMDGEPVGSGLLANYFDMAVSSATLRNEMAALTRWDCWNSPIPAPAACPAPKATVIIWTTAAGLRCHGTGG